MLFGQVLADAAVPWLDHLGKPDRTRLQRIIDLATAEKIRLSDCLEPGEKALQSFTSFRKRVNDAAQAAGVRLRLAVDTKKKNPPPERWCWFEGPDPAVVRAEAFAQEVTADVAGKPFVPVRGQRRSPSGKVMVKFFVSYAHKDDPLASELIDRLQTELRVSKGYEFELWSDRGIHVGEKWDDEIQQAIRECDFGLLLVSPAFLGSEYVAQRELPSFLSGHKPVIPVGLKPVNRETQDLKGLQEHQIYLRKDRFFAQARREEFAHDLQAQIERRLGKQDANLRNALPLPDEVPYFQRTQGMRFSLQDLERITQASTSLSGSRDALDELHAWVRDPDAPPFFALLGEWGIGKTTTLKQFARRLLDEGTTLPIYIDLRDYRGEKPVPDIEELLNTVIQHSWKLTDRSVSARDLLRLVRDEGAVILFDGVDERIVHLTTARARDFIRTLWAALPPSGGQRRGKLLISCRSHYFRDVWSQNAMLAGEDREGIDKQQYPVLCLLPFNEEQIRGYLTGLLGSDQRASETIALFGSVHNLRELAQRPYLLSLISGRLAEIEAMRLRGEMVNAARLYEVVVRSWLSRDDGKHQIDPTHKRRLTEELAAAMWREGVKQWDADRLEDWLDDYMSRNPVVAGAYANKDRAVLKEDLRTATFVLRPDSEQKSFQFAHTSIQEFFLAAHLLRALKDGHVEAWDLPMTSVETLDFLGELLANEPSSARETALRVLSQIPGRDALAAAVLAFRYWLRAIEKGLPEPWPAHIRLADANLEELRIEGHSSDRPLPLRGADLRGALLNRARLKCVDLTDADLTGLEARQAVFEDVRAPKAHLSSVDFCGLRWRGGSLSGADLSSAKLRGCQWMNADLRDAVLPDGWEREAAEAGVLPAAHHAAEITLGLGHASRVTGCAWSPDGSRVVSVSLDTSVKIWDAVSGDCLLTLNGHSHWVATCGWSPDGTRVVSGSFDKSVRVWNAHSGECLLTLTGHSDSVRACAWSPDGARIVSGSDDNTLRIWDAISGDCLLTLAGHAGNVRACAWSPDSARVVSGSRDWRVRIWDAASGDCLHTMIGHKGWVWACAWSPDGSRVLSGSEDYSLKFWDAATGDCLITLAGHTGRVWACAWSPDGARVLSGSGDQGLKIWNAASGHCLHTFVGHTGEITSCGWSPDGARAVSGSRDQSVKIWDAASGHCLLTLAGAPRAINACAWNGDGTRVVSCSDDQTVKIWDSDSGYRLLTLSGHTDSVGVCAWSPDSSRVVSGSYDKTLKIWDSASGHCLRTLAGHSDGITACAWSPDGSRVVSGSYDKTLKVWDPVSGDCLYTLAGHTDSVNACTCSPDGQRVLSGSDDRNLKIWDVSSRSCLVTLAGHSSGVTACGWSPDGARVLSASNDNSLKVWDAVSGECVLTLAGHTGRVWACGWSPDSALAISGSYDGSVKVWNAKSGTCLLTLLGHTCPVWSCGWSPDGARIVSGSDNGALKIWDSATGECLLTTWHLPEHESATIAKGGIVYASSGAWRWLGWGWTDPVTGRMRILPAEHFGDLPTLNRDSSARSPRSLGR